MSLVVFERKVSKEILWAKEKLLMYWNIWMKKEPIIIKFKMGEKNVVAESKNKEINWLVRVSRVQKQMIHGVVYGIFKSWILLRSVHNKYGWIKWSKWPKDVGNKQCWIKWQMIERSSKSHKWPALSRKEKRLIIISYELIF